MIAVLAFLFCSSSALVFNAPAFDYNTTKVRGVNLGGWLVIEPWISPNLFAQWNTASSYPVCEWTLGEFLGKEEVKKRLQAHWDSFYQEADFKRIASWGINVLRLPIGYWAFEARNDEPFVQGQEAYLEKAIVWARKYGLKIWIDLHGAQGSQNGFDNSGRAGGIRFLQGDTQARCLNVWDIIIKKYGQQQYADVIIGFETVNEPANWGVNVDTLKQFNKAVIQKAEATSSTTATIFSDAFLPVLNWQPNNFVAASPRLVLDTHHYQVFDNSQVAWNIDQHRRQTCSTADAFQSSPYNVVVGEWSAALEDCCIWLNGFRKGSRYDGTLNSNKVGNCNENFDKWSQQKKDDTRKFIENQLDQYERRSGWIFWTAKTNGPSPAWDMGLLIEKGLFPQPFTDRKFPKLC